MTKVSTLRKVLRSFSDEGILEAKIKVENSIKENEEPNDRYSFYAVIGFMGDNRKEFFYFLTTSDKLKQLGQNFEEAMMLFRPISLVRYDFVTYKNKWETDSDIPVANFYALCDLAKAKHRKKIEAPSYYKPK